MQNTRTETGIEKNPLLRQVSDSLALKTLERINFEGVGIDLPNEFYLFQFFAYMTHNMLQRKPMETALTDPKIYRDAMARYAGHVQLVTTLHEGIRRGVAVTAACSVSDHPPTVLVCLNHGNVKNQLFFDSGIFALNSLASHHQTLSNGFSGLEDISMEERFARGQWDEMTTGAPTLVDALAVYDCRIIDIRPVASHSILIGEVASVRLGEKNPALIYMDRHYQSL